MPHPHIFLTFSPPSEWKQSSVTGVTLNMLTPGVPVMDRLAERLLEHLKLHQAEKRYSWTYLSSFAAIHMLLLFPFFSPDFFPLLSWLALVFWMGGSTTNWIQLQQCAGRRTTSTRVADHSPLISSGGASIITKLGQLQYSNWLNDFAALQLRHGSFSKKSEESRGEAPIQLLARFGLIRYRFLNSGGWCSSNSSE